MNDKRLNEIVELKQNLEKHDIRLEDWLNYSINDNILNTRLELITIRKMLEEVHHTVILK